MSCPFTARWPFGLANHAERPSREEARGRHALIGLGLIDDVRTATAPDRVDVDQLRGGPAEPSLAAAESSSGCFQGTRCEAKPSDRRRASASAAICDRGEKPSYATRLRVDTPSFCGSTCTSSRTSWRTRSTGWERSRSARGDAPCRPGTTRRPGGAPKGSVIALAFAVFLLAGSARVRAAGGLAGRTPRGEGEADAMPERGGCCACT